MDLTGEGGGRHIHFAAGDRKERHNYRAVSVEEGKRERGKEKDKYKGLMPNCLQWAYEMQDGC